jgi:uncharacterized repeat protein (TIGR01451 family)
MRGSTVNNCVPLRKPLLSVTLSSLLTTALILIPVMPFRPALAASGGGRNNPSESAARLNAAPGAALAAPLVPSLTATKTDSFADPDGDGKAEPGDTITYTVTVTNNGTDAANVQFSDTVDPNTTLVPGSVATQPMASNDSYSVLGNVRIQPNAGGGLLANDCDPDNGGPCSSAGLTASGPNSSAQGGNVTVNGDGSFSYNPPAGFEGTDSFNYTVTDGAGLSDTATATFTVSKMVWFVDNAAPAGGDGRLTAPFNSLAPLNGAADADKPSDVIYVLQGAGPYGGGIVLEDNQRLVGQGTGLDAALAAFGISVPPHSDARPAATGAPTLANAGGDVVALANSNVVSYLNASASAPGSSAVSSNGAGGVTAVDNVGASAGGAANGFGLLNHAGALGVTNSSVAANSSGTAVLVSGGSTPITFNGTTVSQNTGRVVDIQNRTGGTVAFGAGSTVTGTNGGTDAVVLLSNSNSTVTFNAAVNLNTNAAGARGLVADSAGAFTLNMTGGGSAISSTGGAAVDVENLTVNLALATTFSTNSNGRGLRVDNVSGSAAFGNTTVNSSLNTGVLLTGNGAAVTFNDLDIAPAAGQRALHAVGNTGTLSSSSGTIVTSGAVAVEVAGASAASRAPLNVTLTSVSANGDSNGIVLTNTDGPGASVGFVVNGDGLNTADGGNGTGGTIANTVGADGAASGIGIRLENADEVTLRRVQLNDHQNYAVRGFGVSNFTMEYSTVNGTNGTSGAFDEGSLHFTETTGTNLVKGSLLHGGWESTVQIVNTTGTLAGFIFDDCTISQTSVPEGGDALRFESQGTAVMTLAVQNGAITAARDNTLDANAVFGSTMTLKVKSNAISNNHSAVVAGGGGVKISSGGVMSLDVDGNTLRDAVGTALLVNSSGNAAPGAQEGDVQGYVRNNTIGVAGVANSGSASASGISIESNGGGDLDALVVSNNQVFQYNNHAILLNLVDRQGKAVSANVTVEGNTVNTPGTLLTNFNGLHLNAGAVTGDNFAVCLDAKNNNLTGAGKGATSPNNNDIRFRQRILTTVQLPGYAGANNDNAAVINYLRTAPTGIKNNQFTTGNAANTVSTGGGGYVNTPGGAPCTQPSFAALTLPEDAGARQQHLAAADTAAPAQPKAAEAGFSAGRESAASLSKIPRGLAHSERGQLLGASLGEGVETSKTVRTPAAFAAVSGGTVTIPIGTLRAGDSVTITFQVTVSDPFAGSQAQVSNQGTVTADGGLSVLTDDPSEPGGADPTVTPILLPPTININDGTVAEPASGSANAMFTVTLSHPSSQAVTVGYATASGGANPATEGTDYTATGGTVTFNAGETVQTVSVPALADVDAGEPDETFLVNLSGATNGIVGDGTATGTITDGSVASAVIISELRTSGPGGAGDDFVELLNATDGDITVASSDGSAGWSIVKSGAGCSTTPVVVGVIPNGTVIRARGNYLLSGSAYSLGAYAAGDATLSADIEDDRNVGLFTTTNLSNASSVNRLDAVGFGANTGDNCELLREGNNLPAAAGSTSEYSFVRKVTLGLTHDTGDNAADFVVVSTTPSVPVGGNTPTLGAPGPEGGASPTGPVPCAAPAGDDLFGRALVDPTVSNASAPNFVRDPTPVANGTSGTLEFRRAFTNNTGAAVTSLRFRVVGLSTSPSGAGAADLRALSSGAIVVATAGGPATVHGTTLQTPPSQPSGGGVNSSLAAGSVTLATPVPNGASVNLRFLFGVEQAGDYDIAFVLEALPGPSGKDIWKLSGHTENGGHADGGCNEPPVANAGADQTLECSNGQASVTLDGSASFDPDGDTPLGYTWSEGATTLGTGETLNVTLPNGPHTVTLTVTDPSGESSQDTVVVNVVDTTDPVVTPPANVVVTTGPGASSCGAVVSDEALGTASAADGCEGALAVNRSGVPAGNFFPVGTTNVTYTATDAAGNVGTATQTVTVIDNTPPVVTPPANIITSADANSCSATVNPGTASVSDNCSGSTVVGARSDAQPLNAPYPVGTTTITWTGTDANGNTASASQTVTVKDVQPPTVSASVAVTTMGPPFNHAMINVGLSATAADSCPGLQPLQVSVFSDEDDGTGSHSPDAFDLGLGTLKLRRERDGGSNGRVYLVVVRATDASNNTAVSCKTVTVPLSNSAGDQAAVASQASAAAAFCSANGGAPPSGYFAVGP